MNRDEILAKIAQNKVTAITTPQISGLMKAENINLARRLTKMEERK